jgi:hypothetical protein
VDVIPLGCSSDACSAFGVREEEGDGAGRVGTYTMFVRLDRSTFRN